jgi:uncharacterized protein YfaP (DUF2135 family)
MKTTRFFLLLPLLLVLAIGCKKDEAPTTPSSGGGGGGGLTEPEKQAIRQGYQAVSASADTITSTAGFQSMLASYTSNPNVETAYITNNSLFVKFRGGGLISWYLASDVVVPPYDPGGLVASNIPDCLLKPSELIGNTSAVLINQQFGDEGRQYCRDVITFLTTKFQARGFTVTTKNGSQANVNFFKTGLSAYGAVFYIAHGTYDGTNTWQCTGEEGTLDSLMSKYPAEWKSNQLTILTVHEKRGGVNQVVRFYSFSSRLVDSMYVANAFPRSMIYLVACQGMKNGQVGTSFVNKGARAVIGWDETNCLGQSTGKLLFDILLCGKNVRDAMAALPAEAKNDKCAVPAGALLVSYPSSGDTLRLVEESKGVVLFTTPKKDSTYTTRNLTLAGSLVNGDTLTSGIVEVNGVATTLTILSIRKNFSQSIVIDSGRNSIHITANGKLTNGKCAVVDTTINVNGNFAALGLWSELRWNTNSSDVDFHLLPPNAAFPGTFWTTTDCYYGNRTTAWGGFLDVDDVDGYGPEHITVPTVSTQGTYRLFLHYYASHGAGPTSCYVTVSVRGGPNSNFGPYLVTTPGSRGGNIWEVCTITYPAGTITPVNRLTTLALLGRPQVNDKKQAR